MKKRRTNQLNLPQLQLLSSAKFQRTKVEKCTRYKPNLLSIIRRLWSKDLQGSIHRPESMSSQRNKRSRGERILLLQSTRLPAVSVEEWLDEYECQCVVIQASFQVNSWKQRSYWLFSWAWFDQGHQPSVRWSTYPLPLPFQLALHSAGQGASCWSAYC